MNWYEYLFIIWLLIHLSRYSVKYVQKCIIATVVLPVLQILPPYLSNLSVSLCPLYLSYSSIYTDANIIDRFSIPK